MFLKDESQFKQSFEDLKVLSLQSGKYDTLIPK